MKIVSWNVNSVRARINNILDYIESSNPDILLLQEIKTQEETFPFSDFKKLGFESYVFGQKSYNGVAIISKVNIKDFDKIYLVKNIKQSRIISGKIKVQSKEIEIINVYIPNGNPVDTEKYDYKKIWLNELVSKIKKKILDKKNIIIAGDFNIIPDKIDAYDFSRYENDALGRLEIRKKYRELLNLGFQDAYRYKNDNKQEYTFWDYFANSWKKNHGMRIDHFLISNNLLKNINSIKINKSPRSKTKPSDHTPIELILN